MKEPSPARRLIQELAEKAALTVMCRRPKVGEIIEHLPQEKRDVLKELRSEDIADCRPPFWIC
jgi:hypothetical protein